jgi:hypothetical protein
MLSRLKFDLKDLVNEMLDQLPEEVFESNSTTFYDPSMGGGQFVIEVVERLRKYRHSDENISKRVFGSEENKLRVNYVKNLHKLPGDFRTELIKDMKFDVIIGNPPYQETLGGMRGKSIWDRFVIYSFTLLKDQGYLSLIHPTGWRSPRGKFKNIQSLYQSKNMIYLNLGDTQKGIKTFGVGTSYDYFVLQNSPNQGKTHLIDTTGEDSIIDISQFSFIPGNNHKEFQKLVAKNEDEKINFIFDSSYHTQQPHISKTRTPTHIYPIVCDVTQKGGAKIFYSNINTKGHFGLPKVYFSNGGGSYALIDIEGKYGLSQFSYGIVDDVENLENIKNAINSKKFVSLMKNAGFTTWKYDAKVIETFRKDFWKEFIEKTIQ